MTVPDPTALDKGHRKQQDPVCLAPMECLADHCMYYGTGPPILCISVLGQDIKKLYPAAGTPVRQLNQI